MSDLRLPKDDDRAARIVAQARAVYNDTVVEHWLQPRNVGLMKDADGRASLVGSCEDLMEIAVKLDGGRIADARFVTDGCITSIASGSMAVELATGQSVAAAGRISQDVILDALGGLPEESEHCAALAADTLHAAIADALRMNQEPWKRLYRRDP